MKRRFKANWLLPASAGGRRSVVTLEAFQRDRQGDIALGRSCQAWGGISTPPRARREGPALATSWRALLEQRGPLPLCEREEPTPANEAQAKQIVCRGCGYGSHDEGDECLGPAPWAIHTGYQHFHHFYFYVEPLPGGLFYAEGLSDTSIPPAHLVNGRVLTVEGFDVWESVGGLIGRPSDVEPDSAGAAGATPPRCEPETYSGAELDTATGASNGEPTLRMHEPREKKVYDLRRNRHVLTLTEWAGPVEVTLEGDAARLKGAGCDERVPLAP